MNLRLVRTYHPTATTGRLFIDGVYECDTLELPWKENAARESCIPEGTYGVTWAPSLHLERNTLRLSGVARRSGILIHAANTVADLLGCIGLGKCLHTDQLFESRSTVMRVESKVCAALGRGESVTIEVTK